MYLGFFIHRNTRAVFSTAMEVHMATQKRIEDLTTYCERWQDCLKSAIDSRSHLLYLQGMGVSTFENDGPDLLPTLITEADAAVLQYQRILIKMESLRDRAIAGEDV
jgi:hypothetical protein